MKDPFRTVHIVALGLCLVFLPWSTALLSMAQMLLVANWLVEGIARKDRGMRWRLAFGSAPSLFFLGFFGLHVLGLFWTSAEGMDWGVSLVRILLPVLVFGVVLASSPPLEEKEYRSLLLIGAYSVIASTVVCLLMRGMSSEYRQLSAFISHIRLALLLCFSVVVFLHYLAGSIWQQVLHFALVAWAIFFLDLLGSIQAFVILLVVGVVLVWRWTAARRGSLRWAFRAGVLLPFLIGLAWLVQEVGQRYFTEPPSRSELPTHSAAGEPYMHKLNDRQKQNGQHIWSEIAWSEAAWAWEQRSDRSFYGSDDKGHIVYATLFRYLASKRLPKDLEGVNALSDEDVRRIEQGIPDHRMGTRSRIRERFEEVMFEIDNYRAGGDVSGHSVTMRLEFWRAGLAIFQRNWIIGVGTGDTGPAFQRQYELMRSKLKPEWRHRAHDQYLTILISFGLVGGAFAALCLIWPVWRMKALRSPLFIAWALIIGIGSLTDDTIETQAGATFFALYYALFVFAAPRECSPGAGSIHVVARTPEVLDAESR